MLTIERLFETQGADLKIGGPVKEVTLEDDLVVEQWCVPKGTVVRLREGAIFGYVAIPYQQIDKNGVMIPKQIFKY